jgi:predicted RecA/RadA family phage recombinase
VQVNLLDGDGNAVTDGDDNPITTTTDDNGNYEFPGLLPGDYIVEFVANGTPYSFTVNDQGSDDSADSDADPSTGQSPVVTLGIGEINNTIDAGMYQTPSNDSPAVAIGNTVWEDSDNNAKMDTGEAGMSGVEVRLYADVDGDGVAEPGGDDGAPVRTVTTDANGKYLFPGVDPGNYFVAIVPPTGYNSSAGSNADPVPNDQADSSGDDGAPNSGAGVIVTQVFAAAWSTGPTGEEGNPANFPDDSAYMTIDFGLTQDPNAVTLSGMSASSGSALLWALGLLAIGLMGLGAFLWQRRRAM